MNNKIIQYYVKTSYGRDLEYVTDASDARALQLLTGQKTVSETIRKTVTELSGGLIQFEQVLPPAKN